MTTAWQNHADATKLDIDHMVPLKEVHWSGAANWSREHKEPMPMVWMIQTR